MNSIFRQCKNVNFPTAVGRCFAHNLVGKLSKIVKIYCFLYILQRGAKRQHKFSIVNPPHNPMFLCVFVRVVAFLIWCVGEVGINGFFRIDFSNYINNTF